MGLGRERDFGKKPLLHIRKWSNSHTYTHSYTLVWEHRGFQHHLASNLEEFLYLLWFLKAYRAVAAMLGVHYELSWDGVSANHGHISTSPQFSLDYEQGKLKSTCKIPGRNHLKMHSPYITQSFNNPLLQSFIHMLISTDNWKVEQLPTNRKKRLWKKSLQDWGTTCGSQRPLLDGRKALGTLQVQSKAPPKSNLPINTG